jgi:hypothetical protein
MQMQKVENGKFVSVSYNGTLENGEGFDTSEGRLPLEFQTGARQLIKGFEDAVKARVESFITGAGNESIKTIQFRCPTRL